MQPEPGNQKGRKSRGAKTPKSKGAEKVKCSLLLSPENDLRLTVLAAMRGTDRSGLINTILDEALRGVVISLRGSLADGAGEGPQEEPQSGAA
ncbi:hypothetical protein [Tautonia sociabilis]|uniref:Uncharacterized protein n=1 Tax=Tautonia sociabilis TaxID=2080755 RepID=A0A432MF97_9BACT|nr:hypothetical protein [Tautonia sociabilis]RUL84594.1 hypothetical protein TsocGM_20170 [Tautonia sociabilis]